MKDLNDLSVHDLAADYNIADMIVIVRGIS